jgi:surface antigen
MSSTRHRVHIDTGDEKRPPKSSNPVAVVDAALGSRVLLRVAAVLAVAAVLVLASVALAFAGTDDYPAPWRAPSVQDSLVDSWGYYNRECTSFVAWRLHSRNGFEMPRAIGNADAWGGWASNHGYAVNMSPAVGAVAWWSACHVAWVESVNGDGTVTIEEYNYNYNGLYHERTIAASSVSGYIHFKDIVQTPPPPPRPTPLGDPYSVSGDFNGDGRVDWARFVTNGPSDSALWAFLSDGRKFNLSNPYQSGAGNWDVGRSKPVAADIDGDGKAEICAFYDYGSGVTGLWVFKWNGSGFSATEPWLSGAGTWEWPRIKPVAADIDGDGKAEICAFYDYGSGVTGLWVFRWNGSTFAPTQMWSSGAGAWECDRTMPVAGDVDGDGKAEICAFYDYGSSTTGLWIFKWNGSGFALTEPWSSGAGAWEWARIMPVTGDVDGDGKAEICAFYDYGSCSTGLWLFKWNGSGFGLNMPWSQTPGNWELSATRPVAGDADGDGKAEVFALYNYGGDADSLFVWRSDRSWQPFAIWSKPAGGWSSAAFASTTGDFATAASSTSIPVWRFYNFRTGTHFYTADPTEKNNVAANMKNTYSLDGVAYAVNTANTANSTPLWRFYNAKTGTHFYTADLNEKARILATMASTYHLDGAAYNVSATNVTGSTAVWRFYNMKTGTHFYTADTAEKLRVETSMKSTYSLDGPAFYLAP